MIVPVLSHCDLALECAHSSRRGSRLAIRVADFDLVTKLFVRNRIGSPFEGNVVIRRVCDSHAQDQLRARFQRGFRRVERDRKQRCVCRRREGREECKEQDGGAVIDAQRGKRSVDLDLLILLGVRLDDLCVLV